MAKKRLRQYLALALAVVMCVTPLTAQAGDGGLETDLAEETTVLLEDPSEEPIEDPVEELETVPEAVQAFLDAVDALEETEESVNACGAAYDALTEEEQEREDVVAAYLAFMDVVERLNPIMLLDGEGTSADNPVPVPEDGLVIDSNGVLKGVKKEWIDQQTKDADGKLYVTVTVPGTVTAIGECMFDPNKEKVCKLVQIDFSSAGSLTTIGKQAFNSCKLLTGVLDLSGTNLNDISKMAFQGCTGLTGVILPSSLTSIGNASGGSVFKDCRSLQFIRTADGDPDAVFELPPNLTCIMGYAFQNCFADGVDAKVVIPASVETIGSEAFYDSHISQIVVKKRGKGGWNSILGPYDGSAFKTGNDNLVIIFNDEKSYSDYKFSHNLTNAVKKAMAYPITLKFGGAGIQQEKLLYQSIQYTYDETTGFWELDSSYKLPEAKDALSNKPGYIGDHWTLNEQVLKDTSVLSDKYFLGSPDSLTATVAYALKLPEIQYSINGELQGPRDDEIPNLVVTVEKDKTATVGVWVDHELLKAEDRFGTEADYVYFKYCWWDEVNSSTGPRATEEPDLFTQTPDSVTYHRHPTDQAEIPIESKGHERVGTGDYYLVEVFGYHVVNGRETQFYQSAHNVLAGTANPENAPCLLMKVAVNEVIYHAITLDAGGGTFPDGTQSASIEVKDGETIPRPADPTREGYAFTGWHKDDTPWDFDAPVTGDMTLTAQWEKLYTVTWQDWDGTVLETDTGLTAGTVPSYGGADPTRPATAEASYTFAGWHPAVTAVTGDAFYTAQYTTQANAYTLTIRYVYENGVAAAADHIEVLTVGANYDVPSPEVSGYTADREVVRGAMPAENVAVTVTYTRNYIPTPPTPPTPPRPEEPDTPDEPDEPVVDITDQEVPLISDPGLDTEEHFAYIAGYPDGTVRPDGKITRAEVAAIFYRLLTEESRSKYWTRESGYSDVAAESWYGPAIATLSAAGIVDGYPDGTFRPDAGITRAEFVKVAVSFLLYQNETYGGTFSDVTEGQWFAGYVFTAAAQGLVDGYPDGTFRPDAGITRAEVCAIVNRTLGRRPHADHLLPEAEMIVWPDNADKTAWYYVHVQEATNSHDYVLEETETAEQWMEKLPERDWSALEARWAGTMG